MRKQLLFVTALCAGLGAVAAQAMQVTSPDIFLISRSEEGTFLGSHKIFERESSGLRQVSYCGRSYWVRPVTVAWTEVEVENEHSVRVEYNKGLGWLPICSQPEKQVTLNDLGITENARFILRTNGKTLESTQRFSAIREAFQMMSGNSRQKTTFHDE